MAEEYEIVRANLLPPATSVSENDMLLVVQAGRLKRVPPSLMKGRPGDQGLSSYLGVSATFIQWKQGINGAWQNLIEIERLRGPKGEKPIFRKVGGTLQMKYEGEPDTAWLNIFDRDELKMKFSDLTADEVSQLKLHFSDLTTEDVKELQKPAREAADELNKVKTAFEEFSKITVLAESNRVKAEEQRVRIEGLRVEAEEARAAAETARKSAEEMREDAEVLRDQTETERINAETARKEAESSRVLVEGLRVDEEAKRAAAELARIQAEQGRAAEEGKRAEEEQKRATAEALRDKSEKNRDEAEGLRDQAETFRAAEEADRDTAEQERIKEETERDNAEQERIAKEAKRVETEGARIVEEELRKNAERARKEAEAGRVTAEEEREKNTTQAILDTEEATEKTKAATAITLDLNAHPMKIMGGIWFEWSVVDQEYKNTGIQAKGDTGSSFKIVGRYDTLDELKAAVPDGTLVDGVYAVGAVEPFSYYAWLVIDGVWQWDNQGKLRGAEGKSSYEVWTEYPEHEGKTKEDYFDWLSPVIDPDTGRWKVQGQDQGVQALGINAEVTEKENTEDSYILHVKSAKGEFDTPNIRGISVKVSEIENTEDSYKLGFKHAKGDFTTPNLRGISVKVVEKENTPDKYVLTFTHAKGEFTTPNLRGFDVKVEEVESNTPDDYKLKITTVAGTIITPNLQGRSGSAVIDIDHEPTEADTHYTYNGVQYAFSVGDEVRWYDADNEEYVLFKLYAVTEVGATWEELGSGGISLPADVILSSPTTLSDDDSLIFLDNGYLKGEA